MPLETKNHGFTGTITSTAAFTSSAQTREIDYTYDHNGLRTGKVVTENGSPEYTKYTLHGKLITHITKLVRGGKDFRVSQRLHFYYDAQSRPAFVEYSGMKYRYLHNLQGDIVGIVDNIGNLVVEYRYDAWGKPISTTGSMADTLGKQNPFRYRGYVYDEETGLYYLRSRYYNPVSNRFCLPDVFITDGLCNTFAYTQNLVVKAKDDYGLKTYAVGTTCTAVAGFFGSSVTRGFCWDDSGNSGTFVTYGGLEGNFVIDEATLGDFNTAYVGGAGLSATDFVQYTSLETIRDLEGVCHAVGCSFGAGISFGVDVICSGSASSTGGEVIGVQSSLGVGVGFDPLHVSNQYTIVMITEGQCGVGRKDVLRDRAHQASSKQPDPWGMPELEVRYDDVLKKYREYVV